MNEPDPNLSPQKRSGLTEFLRRVGDTSFYRKTQAYRSAVLRGSLGIGIAYIAHIKTNPGDVLGAILAALIAWRLFLDSSASDARAAASKIT
jgi:hypothetical protein